MSKKSHFTINTELLHGTARESSLPSSIFNTVDSTHTDLTFRSEGATVPTTDVATVPADVQLTPCPYCHQLCETVPLMPVENDNFEDLMERRQMLFDLMYVGYDNYYVACSTIY